MPFRFTLEALLRLRKHELRQAQNLLAIAQNRYVEAVREKDELKSRLKALLGLWEQEQSRGMPVGSLLAFGDYERFLEQELLKKERERLKAHEILEEKKSGVVEAEKAVKILEGLEKREHTSYLDARRRKEQKELDEVSVLRSTRGNDSNDTS